MNKVLTTTVIVIVGICIFAQIGFAALTAIESQASPMVSVEPEYQVVSKGEYFTVNIKVYPEKSEVFAASYTLYFNNTLLNAIGQTKGGFLSQDGAETWELVNETNNTLGKIKYGESRKEVDYGVNGSGVLAAITFQAIADHGISELCIGDLDGVILADPNYTSIPTNVTNGNIEIKPKPSIFDTGKPENPYPSIFGIHNGTIILNHTLFVNKIFTYSCPGTGGHTEYVAFYNTTTGEEIANGTWKGYAGDWHNITFKKPFELQADTIYNYTLKTGSYPQIIHTTEPEYEATGGKITCDEFINANGLVHENWIPAIRLCGVVE